MNDETSGYTRDEAISAVEEHYDTYATVKSPAKQVWCKLTTWHNTSTTIVSVGFDPDGCIALKYCNLCGKRL